MTAEEVVPRGLEPQTLRLLAVRSNQLSYETSWRFFENCLELPGVAWSCQEWLPVEKGDLALEAESVLT